MSAPALVWTRIFAEELPRFFEQLPECFALLWLPSIQGEPEGQVRACFRNRAAHAMPLPGLEAICGQQETQADAARELAQVIEGLEPDTPPRTVHGLQAIGDKDGQPDAPCFTVHAWRVGDYVALVWRPDAQTQAGDQARASDRSAPVDRAGGYGKLAPQSDRQLKTIYKLSTAVSSAAELDEIVEAAQDGLIAAAGADRTSVMLFAPDGVMRFRGWRGLSQTYRQAVEGHSPWRPDDAQARPITVADVPGDPSLTEELRQTVLHEGIQALAFIPLISRGRVLGKFMVYYDQPHDFLPSELEVCQTIAGHVAFAIERMQAELELRESEDRHRQLSGRLRVLLRATSRLIESLEPQDLLDSVLKIAQQVVSADAFAVWREDEQGLWRVVSSHGLPESFLHEAVTRPRDAETVDELVVLQPEDMIKRADPLFANRWDRLREEGIQSLMLAPLHIHDEHAASMVFYCKCPYRFTPTDEEAAAALANITAAALTTSELYEAQSSLRHRAETAAAREAFLAATGAILSETLDDEAVFEKLATVAVPSFADWCAVDLYYPARNAAGDAGGRGRLRRVALEHAGAVELGDVPALNPEPTGGEADASGIRRVIETRSSEMSQLTSPQASAEAAVASTSYICVPIVLNEQVYGVVSFAIVSPRGAFTDEDLAAAKEVARRVAQAINNAHLYRRLRDSEQRLRLATSAGGIGVWDWHIAHNQVEWSESLYTILGMTPDAFDGTMEALIDLVHPEDRQRVSLEFENALTEEAPFDVEFRVQRPDGEVSWLYTDASVLLSDEGVPERVLGAIVDITQRKEAELALRESEQRFKQMADTAPATLWITNEHNECAFISRGWYELTDQADGEALGFGWFDAVHPDDREHTLDAFLRAARSRQPFTVDYRLRCGDGEYRWVSDAGRPRLDDDGRLIGYIGSVIDVHERTLAERGLQESRDVLEQHVAERTLELQQRADQLSRLSSQLTLAEQRERRRLAQVLHDHLQQLLVGAKFGLDLLSRDVGEKQQQAVRDVNSLIDDAIQSSRSLTVELSPPILHEAGLAAGLDWLARWMKEKHGLHVVVDVDERADSDREDVSVLVFQAVRELLFNVVKHAGVTEACVELAVHNDDHLRVVVEDEGRGFDLDEADGGSGDMGGGFGLFSIRERLSLLGARLEIKSKPGEGSTFTIIAPMGRGANSIDVESDREAMLDADTIRSIRMASKRRSQSESNAICVLLADDHEVMRQGLAMLIAADPEMEVVGEASDGVEAVELAKALQPDIVLMDFSMPRMDGVEATQRISELAIKSQVIGLSMYDMPDRASAMLRAGAAAYLTKSGESSVLLDKIREVYQSAAPAAVHRAGAGL